MFPQFASGPFLDWHGEPIGVFRRVATHSTGDVLIIGKPETIIPRGTLLATIGDENEAGYLFEVVNTVAIDANGQALLRVKAVDPGVEANVPAGSIQGIVGSINGVTAITNPERTEGGTDEEGDESYRFRVVDRHQNKPLSGSRKDYERWAREVSGVGDVIVLPLWNGPKTVKVLVTDSERQLATIELIEAVQLHIAPDGDLGGGLAPIGALVTVDTITTVPVVIAITSLVIAEGYELEEVRQNIRDSINLYFSDKPLVKWSEVGAAITNTKGVADHGGWLLDDSINNIILEKGERAVVGEVLIE
ncbi:baseplate J/gp47 family protein [Sporosarcina sp. FSL K6-1508]|uniref:baseplate J/gp47 family protein n=1 Tax=Sporosarcina sp. FSL K6-1508 TaxID=2921553 RepID=UPI0030F79AEB